MCTLDENVRCARSMSTLDVHARCVFRSASASSTWHASERLGSPHVRCAYVCYAYARAPAWRTPTPWRGSEALREAALAAARRQSERAIGAPRRRPEPRPVHTRKPRRSRAQSAAWDGGKRRAMRGGRESCRARGGADKEMCSLSPMLSSTAIIGQRHAAHTPA
eukprot:2396108-Pleurochrysis_carterae.AAC.1